MRSDPGSPVIQEGTSLLGASREPTPPLSLRLTKVNFLSGVARSPALLHPCLRVCLLLLLPSDHHLSSLPLRFHAGPPPEASSPAAPPLPVAHFLLSMPLPSLNKPTLCGGSAQAPASGVLSAHRWGHQVLWGQLTAGGAQNSVTGSQKTRQGIQGPRM